MPLTRRASLAGISLLATPAVLRAQPAPLRLGVLTPLTGAGGFDGPRMLNAIQKVAGEINASGGLLGQQIDLAVEDTQTSPENAVRAAHKLIDVDRVPVIMGTWASAVTSAVAPVCWEGKTFLTTCSGADTITHLPHQGYLIRTQPNNYLQAAAHADFIAGLGARRVFILSIQSPFAIPTQTRLKEVLTQHNVTYAGDLIYEKDKTSYRSEVDQALRTQPDLIYLNGYAPDVTVYLRELYRAGFEGPRFTQSYALTPKILEGLPPDVTNKTYTGQPSADISSPAFDLATRRLGHDPDSYECQATDWISLVALAIARAGSATGIAIRDNVRPISQGSGQKTYSAVDGLKQLAAGQPINYEGASGPCDFTDIGDIISCKFRFQEAEDGKFKLISVI